MRTSEMVGDAHPKELQGASGRRSNDVLYGQETEVPRFMRSSLIIVGRKETMMRGIE